MSSRASNTSTNDNASSKPGLSSIFLIEVEKGKKAYRYDIEIFASDNPLKRGWSLTRGSADLNRRISSELLYIAINKANLLILPNTYVYDGRSIFYSSIEIQMCDTIQITYEEVGKLIKETFSPETKFHVTFKPCRTANRILDLSDLSQYETNNTSLLQEDRSLRNFFELAIAQKTLESDKFISLGFGRLFKRIPDGPPYSRGNYITFHSGICKGVRIVKGNDNHVQPALVLDAKVSAFLTSQTVEKTIYEFRRFNESQPDCWDKLVNFLRGFKVQCAYNRSRIFTIGGFGDKPLSAERRFERIIDGTTVLVTLVDYFKDVKNIKLNNLKLPGVYPVGKPDEKFPVEQLIILEGQKIPQEKQSSDLIDTLLKKNSISPGERHFNIRQSGKELALWDGNNYVLSAFSIKVQSESNDTCIDVRPLPRLLYKNNQEVTPSNDKGDWSKNSGNFIIPASFPPVWMVICHANHSDLVEKFLKALHNRCNDKGMPFGKPQIFPKGQNLFDVETKEPNSNEWRSCFCYCAKQKIPFVLMIDSKSNDSHGLLKLFEVYRRSKVPKLITQQITIETVKNIIDKGHKQTLDNIVNKLNIKFGGLNYQPLLSKPKLSGLGKFEQLFDLSNGNILVIGYDVSHPTNKIQDGNKKQPHLNGGSTDIDIEMNENEEDLILTSTEPSVVGICANMAENPNSFIGDYFYQTSRKESVDLPTLEQRSRWILASLEYNRPLQKCPEYVFILRDGLSEGQYEMAYRNELVAIKKGFALHNPKYSPKCVLVIGSKRHFKKFFGLDNNKPANMVPGSIIHEKVVRPDVFEFYLQSHFPVKGTGKPVEYAVLTNEIKFNCSRELLIEYAKLLGYKQASQEHLQEIMFKRSLYSFLITLSFNHQIVSKPISLPEPVFQADELAKRGHSNYSTLKKFYPNEVPYTNEQHCGHRLTDNNQLTRMLSYWGDGQIVLKNRFNA